MMAQAAPAPEPEDDGHEETVEEVRAKMKMAQETMNAGIQNAEDRSAQATQEMAEMPSYEALGTITDTIHKMGMS